MSVSVTLLCLFRFIFRFISSSHSLRTVCVCVCVCVCVSYLLDPAVHVQVDDPVWGRSGAHIPLSCPRLRCVAVRLLLRAPCRSSPVRPTQTARVRVESAGRHHPTCPPVWVSVRPWLRPSTCLCVHSVSACLTPPPVCLSLSDRISLKPAGPRASPPPWRPPGSARAHSLTHARARSLTRTNTHTYSHTQTQVCAGRLRQKSCGVCFCVKTPGGEEL